MRSKLFILCALAGALLCTAPSAIAAQSHFYLTSIGTGPGAGAGQLSLMPGNYNEAGSGVAVNDETHDVYVADTGNNRVDEFTSGGIFVMAFGRGVGPLGEDTCTALTTCKAGVSGIEPGELEAPTFVAIDNDPASSSHGDVYVAGPGPGNLVTPDNPVTKFSSEGALEEGWGVKGQLDGSSAPEGPFGQLAGLAVDGSGNLWVYVGGTIHAQNDHMYEFEQGGGFTQSWEGGAHAGGYSPQGIAVDGSGDLYISENARDIQKYTPGGSSLGLVSESSTKTESITGLAVAPVRNDLYVDEGTSIENVSPACEPSLTGCLPTQVFGVPQLEDAQGLAVDSAGVVYAADAGVDQIAVFAVAVEATIASASNARATTLTVNGKVDPDGSQISECAFEYGETTTYGQSAPCAESPAEIGAGVVPVEVHADLTALNPNATYHVRLVAGNSKGTVKSEDGLVKTLPVPGIAGAMAVNVTSSSAGLQGTVDPEGFPVTSCVFEYGTSTAYGLTVPCDQSEAALGAGSEPVSVSATVTGLSSDTEYHWRLVAGDVNGQGIGVDHTFVYDTTGGGLPDRRAYEMVSPPQKNGALIGDVFNPPPDLSDDGSRVVAPSIQCFASSPSCTGSRSQQEGEPYEFTRTSAGWVTTPLAPPAEEQLNAMFKYGAEDGVALFTQPTAPGGEDDWYVHQPDGSLADLGPTTPPGTSGIESIGSTLTDSTADLSHLVWDAGENPGWPFNKTTAGESVYEYAGTCGGPSECEVAQPLLVGVTGSQGSTDLIGTCGTLLGADPHFAGGAMSADGRTVYFTVTPCGHGSGANEHTPVPAYELYARIDGELPDAHTVPISTPAPEPECDATCQSRPARDAKFQGASEDGSKVFFTSTQQLVDGATQDANGSDSAISGCPSTKANAGGCNLYESECPSHCASASERRLIDVSAGDTSGLGPQVQGVAAVSADGSHVYFVANGVLAAGATPGNCEHNGGGHCNLYVYQRDAQYPDGHTAFIASLPGADFTMGYQAPIFWDVTPDGRFFVFNSTGDLTPDDTQGGVQVFRYDAQAEQLVRISVGDDGFNDDGNAGVGDATIVPPEKSAGPARGNPTMSDDGSFVFFQSPIALTPQALNDVVIGHREAEVPERSGKVVPVGAEYAENVYEYHDGRVYLISDGRDVSSANGPCGSRTSGQELFFSAVCLYGTDASGSDVFFTSADRLAPADTDTQLDIYDARVCEPESGNPCIQPAPAAQPPCLGEACHGIPAATPSLLSPGSASFNGQGNIAPAAPAAVKPKAKAKPTKCKPGFIKNKKSKCAPKSKKKRAKAKRSAHTNRRASR
jgi:hypothetical protein